LKTRLSILLVASLVAFTSATLPAQAAEPTVAGLWQKQDESGKSMGWFLFVERNGGVFEGAARRRSQSDLHRMHGRPQECAAARHVLHPRHEAHRIALR